MDLVGRGEDRRWSELTCGRRSFRGRLCVMGRLVSDNIGLWSGGGLFVCVRGDSANQASLLEFKGAELLVDDLPYDLV